MPPENTPAFAVVYADRTFGRSVAMTLVYSFYVKFGPRDPKTIEAQITLDRLLADAPVQIPIPNRRSSCEVRKAGPAAD